MLNHNNSELLAMVGHLYDAATDMQKWPVFLEALGNFFNAPYTNILHFDPNEERFNFWLTHGPQLPEDLVEAFQESFKTDPRLIACNQFPGKPLSCRLSIGEEAWHQSDAYKVLSENKDRHPVIEYSLSVTLPEEEGTTTGLAIMRWEDGQAFTQEECDLLSELTPHLRRAIDLQKRFVKSDFANRTALEVLDHIPTGIIVCDRHGCVNFSNSVADEIIGRKDGISIIQETVALNNQDQNSELYQYIRYALEQALSNDIQPGQTFSISRQNEDENYSVLVSTLWGNHVKLGIGVLDEPMAVLFVTDPDRPQEAPAELLQRLYGLTPSEARLTEYLISNNSLDEASFRAGITLSTARQYLKSIFLKTETDRQTALVKKIMSSPIWLQIQPQTNR